MLEFIENYINVERIENTSVCFTDFEKFNNHMTACINYSNVDLKKHKDINNDKIFNHFLNLIIKKSEINEFNGKELNQDILKDICNYLSAKKSQDVIYEGEHDFIIINKKLYNNHKFKFNNAKIIATNLIKEHIIFGQICKISEKFSGLHLICKDFDERKVKLNIINDKPNYFYYTIAELGYHIYNNYKVCHFDKKLIEKYAK